MLKILLSLLFYLTLNASNYPVFSDKELNNIEKEVGYIAKNRVSDYVKTVESYKKLPKKKQLTKVNFYLNQLLPQYDTVVNNRDDHWATPKEFLTLGYGDCEDYVIIKYFTIIKLGFSEDKLFMTTVTEAFTGGYHMVLSYFESKNKPPLILDNLSFKILDLKTRNDLKEDLFINSTGVYKLDKNNHLVKIGNKSKKFIELMQRVKKEL